MSIRLDTLPIEYEMQVRMNTTKFEAEYWLDNVVCYLSVESDEKLFLHFDNQNYIMIFKSVTGFAAALTDMDVVDFDRSSLLDIEDSSVIKISKTSEGYKLDVY